MFVHNYQRHPKVAEAKIVVWLFYIIGVPVWSYAIYINIETWKGDVLFVAGLIVMAIKGYYLVRRNEAMGRKENQEERLREIEIAERTLNSMKKKSSL